MRLFDDKNLLTGDIIDLLNADTNEAFATGTITAIRETTFEETVKGVDDTTELYDMYKTYYRRDIKPTDVAKIVRIDLK